MPYPTQHISISINRAADEVYAYVSNPENLPWWASGLSGSIREEGGEWIAESPMGRVSIRFAPQNELGVLDHYVTLADGATFYNPMRVFANGDGCEVVFTLFRLPGTSDPEYEADAKTIEKDLNALKTILEA